MKGAGKGGKGGGRAEGQEVGQEGVLQSRPVWRHRGESRRVESTTTLGTECMGGGPHARIRVGSRAWGGVWIMGFDATGHEGLPLGAFGTEGLQAGRFAGPRGQADDVAVGGHWELAFLGGRLRQQASPGMENPKHMLTRPPSVEEPEAPLGRVGAILARRSGVV